MLKSVVVVVVAFLALVSSAHAADVENVKIYKFNPYLLSCEGINCEDITGIPDKKVVTPAPISISKEQLYTSDISRDLGLIIRQNSLEERDLELNFEDDFYKTINFNDLNRYTLEKQVVSSLNQITTINYDLNNDMTVLEVPRLDLEWKREMDLKFTSILSLDVDTSEFDWTLPYGGGNLWIDLGYEDGNLVTYDTGIMYPIIDITLSKAV